MSLAIVALIVIGFLLFNAQKNPDKNFLKSFKEKFTDNERDKA